MSSRLVGRVVTIRSLHKSVKNEARGPLTHPGWFLRDHQPNEYPKNEEERRASAVRYGLRPEDYQPIDPDNVNQFAGDYPDLGLVTFSNKDPYEAYTDSWNRRNWGEQVIKDFMKHQGDRNSFTGLDIDDFTVWKGVSMSLVVLVPLMILAYLTNSGNPDAFRYRNPVLIKQYPYDYGRSFPWRDPREFPIVNYTFEPAE